MNNKILNILIKAEDKASKVMGTVGDTMERVSSKIVSASRVAAVASGAAFAALGVGALKATSNLEQTFGGSEVVFGKYAKALQKTAKESAKVMGTSMDQYLGTANKMGSLFQGAGFDVKASMKMTSESMQRATDVATAMGIDTSMALESIAGAAKGNFTMMDNLGVAMNDTTLEAYRLEKGIGTAVTKMTSSEKVGLAMQMFMERTAKYAGNYARENETLAGSFQTLKGSWENFLAGVDGSDKQLADAAFNMIEVLSKNIPEIAGRLGSSIAGVYEEIKKASPVFDSYASIAEGAFTKVKNTFDKTVGRISSTLDKVSESASKGDWKAVGEEIGRSLATALSLLGAKLGPIFEQSMKKLKDIDWVGIGIEIGKQLPALFVGLAAGIMNFDLAGLFQVIWNHLPEILLAGLSLALMPAKLIGGLGQILAKIPLVGTILKWLLDTFTTASKFIFDKGMDLVSSFGKGFSSALGLHMPKVVGELGQALSLIPTRIGLFGIQAWNSAKLFVGGIGGAIGEGVYPITARGAQLINGLWNGARGVFSSMVGWVSSIGSRIVGSVGNPGGLLVGAGNAILDGLWNGMLSKWKQVQGWVKGIAGWIADNKGPISYDRKLLVGAGNAIMDGLNRGLIQGFEQVQGTVKGMGGAIDGAFNGSYSPTVQGKYSMTGNERNDTGTSVGSNSHTFNMYGNVILNNKDDIDYFFSRQDKVSELSNYGVGM